MAALVGTLRFCTALALLTALTTAIVTPARADEPTDGSLAEAARAAYTYTYPLVSMEVTRRQNTNFPVAVPAVGVAPMNRIGSLNHLPNPDFGAVVRPNVDTLYSSLWFDVAAEPLVVDVPDMRGRYHVLPVMDMWTNVEAAPGTRTLGDGPYRFALVGPDWRGSLPPGVLEYRMSTNTGWMIGRISVEGPDDVPNVTALQQQLTAVPLSALGHPYTPPPNTDLHPDWPRRVRVADYIAGLTPQQYWDLYYSAASHQQPRAGDAALLAELAGHGWTPDRPLHLDQLPAADRAVWENAMPAALSTFAKDTTTPPIDGWRTPRDSLGSYGTDYLARAVAAATILGANLPQDAVYSFHETDDRGEPLRSDRQYLLHFDADRIPPVDGFWSVTLYNGQGFLADNPIDRYSVRGERLTRNPDGSVDIHLQRDNPGPDREANWLPLPAEGAANLTMRLYRPRAEITSGSWNPPPVQRTS